jgi:PBP1b-binding outer membrane lipoprotein LpoB
LFRRTRGICYQRDGGLPSGFDKRRQTVEDALMKSGCAGIAIALLLAACATTAPVQEMAAARSAIQTAKEIPRTSPSADLALKSAEQMLNEAAEEIRQEHYERARQLALSAKRKAQSAVQMKQKP